MNQLRDDARRDEIGLADEFKFRPARPAWKARTFTFGWQGRPNSLYQAGRVHHILLDLPTSEMDVSRFLGYRRTKDEADRGAGRMSGGFIRSL
jgi:hypothetical protein